MTTRNDVLEEVARWHMAHMETAKASEKIMREQSENYTRMADQSSGQAAFHRSSAAAILALKDK